METQAMRFERASAMPAPTWHFLKMNDTVVEIPEGLAISPSVAVSKPWSSRGAADEFENALADAQVIWEDEHPAPTAEQIAEREAFLAAEADATYGGTARSGYQVKADALEEARLLALAFEQGVGDETAAYLRYAAGEHIVVEAEPGAVVDAQVVVSSAGGALSAAAIDVIANQGSTVRLSVVVDSPEEPSDGPKMTGTTMRVFADDDSTVEVVRTQALDDDVVDIDDMGYFLAKSARVSVEQTVLGGAKTFTGFAADLRGAASRLDVETRYLGHGTQEHDINYVVRHHGPKTECNLNANGVLAGTSKKTLRGTIDLIRGAVGAQGSEKETVLLVDEGVQNKTVPVILCNEDDVAGNHGATIGHIRPEQLFYLASRGLSQEAAERMFVGAIVEQAAIDAPDDQARRAVVRLGERVSPGFSELFDEGE